MNIVTTPPKTILQRLLQPLRTLTINITIRLMNLIYDLQSDANEPLGLRDLILLWIDDRLLSLFNFAYDGSDQEIQAVRDSEIPISAMSQRQLDSIETSELFRNVHCPNCRWTGTWPALHSKRCPTCKSSVYLDQ